MNEENRLSHNDPIFHLIAPANSPLWGTAEELRHWIRQWHENGCPTANDPPDIKRIERLAEIEASDEKRRQENKERARRLSEQRQKSKPAIVEPAPIEPAPSLSISESMDLLRREIAGEKFKKGTHESIQIDRARLYVCKLRDDGKKPTAIAKRYNLPIYAVMMIYNEYQIKKGAGTPGTGKE